MKVLVGKTFGLGNAVMAVPMIKLLNHFNYQVDVLVGSTPDDVGAIEVMQEFKRSHDYVHEIHVDYVNQDIEYDVAIMSIPFDGRWLNGTHFKAKKVLDGRTRPDPSTTGLISWKKHEAEYQTELVFKELGFGVHRIPSSEFCGQLGPVDPNLVYLGLGFKRDKSGFWSKKHWGNDNFVAFMQRVKEIRPAATFTTTGGPLDLPVIVDLARRSKSLSFEIKSLSASFKDVARSFAYFGNDTGMMHVAASMNKPTYGMMAFEGSDIKNPPLCQCSVADSFALIDRNPADVAERFVEFAWG